MATLACNINYLVSKFNQLVILTMDTNFQISIMILLPAVF